MECPPPGVQPDFGFPGLGPNEATALLRSIFTSLGEAVLVIDATSRCIISCNPAVEEIFGYRPEELLGQDTSMLHLSPESFARFGAISEAALDQRRVFRGGYRMRHRDGREIVTEHTVTPIFPGQGWRAGVVSVVRDVTDHKRAEEERLVYQERLRALAHQLSGAEARERRRLAADLHDRVAQNLALIRWELDAIAAAGLAPDLRKHLDVAREELSQALRDVRSLTFDLCPPILATLGLAAALQSLAEEFFDRHGLDCRVKDDGNSKPLGPEMRDLLYRAVRELLFNVIRHAWAGSATVSLCRSGESIQIEVADDGVGFAKGDSARRRGGDAGFGLFSIGERLAYLGGECRVASAPGNGTRVTLVAPLAGSA